VSNRYYGLVGAVLVSATTFGQVREALALAPDSRAVGEEGSESSAASELIERGIASRRAGNDARALEQFKQAEKLEPDSTRIQVHLAATYQALGNWELSDHYLSLATDKPDDPYVQKHQAVLANARRTIDAHIGTLELSGGPRGTELKLNGRAIGTLPMAQPVRVEAGIYTLEARLPGHYPVTRSVALAGGAVVRESIALAPLEGDTGTPMGSEDRTTATSSSGKPSWLTWTFGGLAVGAGVGTVVAWTIREHHVDNYNDDGRCLRPGQTRGEVCGSERRAGDRAETWMWISGAATGAFAAASAVSLWLNSEDAEQSPQTALGCGIGIGQVSCRGHF
jgi:hypothetical protein